MPRRRVPRRKGQVEIEATPGLTGRPSTLTPQLGAAIVQGVRAGNYQSVAARLCNVSPDTVGSWIARGTPGTKRYTEQGPRAAEDPDVYPDDHPIAELRGTPYPGRFALFALDVARAEAEAEATAISAVRAGMVKDWRAAAEYLRRKHPDRWGDALRIDHSGEQAVSLEVRTDEGWVLGILEVFERAGVLGDIVGGLPGETVNGNGNGKQH